MALTKVKGSILSDELYRREHNLNDVLNKETARNNLSVYSKDQVNGMAAPLPDFHLPLNDNIMIREGIGTPYTDGIPIYHADFTRASTATYLSKSGELKTATVNEPRFEQEGILIEGQSTNLIKHSNSAHLAETETNEYGSLTKITAKRVDDYSVIAAVKNQDSEKFFSPRELETYKAGDVCTTSYTVKPVIGCSIVIIGWFMRRSDNSEHYPRIGYDFNTGVVLKWDFDEILNCTATKVDDGFVRLTMTIRNPADTTGSSTYCYTSNATELVQNLSARYTTTVDVELAVKNYQTEKLPFASSYIPTDGSAVTRAADRLSFSPTDNFHYKREDSWTAFITADTQFQNPFPRIFQSNSGSDNTSFFMHFIQNKSNQLTLNIAGNTGAAAVSVEGADFTKYGIITVTAKDDLYKFYCNGIYGASRTMSIPDDTYEAPNMTIGGDGSRQMYGHIKDLKIWNHALTAEQIAALGSA